MGSTQALVFPNTDAKVGYAQFGSEGFATFEKLMDRKEQQMATLGARMLAPEKKDAEAAQTQWIKRGGESSMLSSICGVSERQIEKALTFAAEWQGITGEVSIELNRDFFPPTFTAADVTSWTSAMQSGAISKEAYFAVLKYSEWLANDIDFEEEQERIASDGLPLSDLKDDH